MPYISQIVDIINNTLANGKIKDDIRFRKQLHGLAELLPRHINDDQNAIPALVSLTNNITFSGFDDSKSIVIYHRCVETEIIESEFQFGDGGCRCKCTTRKRRIGWYCRFIGRRLIDGTWRMDIRKKFPRAV